MRALLVVCVASACGRVGFGARPSPGDGASSDGVDGSGSGVPAQFVPPWHSGSRLRARTLVGGGDPIFYGWHDTQLDSDCQPTIASDGMERCMPYSARADRIYSDAACTQPLALVYQGTCGKNGYAFAENGGTHEYAIGAPYFGTIYSMSPTCAATSLPPAQQAYKLGVEEPPTSFVLSSYHHQTVGSFEHSFNDFADGATIDTGELELANAACNPVATEVGPVRCRTIAPRATPAYADAGCTQPILAWERTQYDPPATDLLAVYPPQACNSTYTLYQTIADVTTPQYWVRDAGGCSLTTSGASVVLYTATAIADPAPMGTLSRGPDRGRIGTFYWTGPDNVAIPAGNFDQQLGTPCTPFNAADGALRCLPSQPVIETALEDATCTGVPQSLFGACFGAPPVDGPGYSSCFDAPWHVHSLPMTVPVASHFDATSCVTIAWPGGVGYEQQTTGAELPATMFPALTELVEQVYRSRMKKVAVLGSGQVGEVLANGFLKHGYAVMRASREPAKLATWKSGAKGEASTGTFADAAKWGEVIVLAVKGSAAEAALDQAGLANLAGKTVIDTTNPIADAPPQNGVIVYFTNANESLMERLQKKAPQAKLVKAFNSVGSAFMVDPKFEDPPSMFICGNDAAAKTETTEILSKFGWDTVDMGAVEAARPIEALCQLWCLPGFTRNDWAHAFRYMKPA